MTECLLNCPLCKSGNILNHLLIKDHAVSNKEFTLFRCGDCELLFTNPRPKEEEIGPYYDFREYYSHGNQVQNFTQWLYQKIRKSSIRRKLELINGLTKSRSLLDYGCGTGEFLQEAKRQRWIVRGIEPSEKARTQAIKKLPSGVVETLSEVPELEAYDVVTLFHVLEHIHRLRDTINKITSHLKSNGYLVIAVPNPESPDAKHYDKDWAGYDVPRHLYHFSRQSISIFQEQFELELVRVEPLVYDSYYVSLLSEGYKNQGSGLISRYFKAFIQGYRSNQKARRLGNYSSNIFIFKKK
ncbi:MAG: class I SAM-dependent methyltransferase [Bacteroidetes bacterium]|nr:class I SAM-dependent methyltransferase [Bacteroidota bacterium]